MAASLSGGGLSSGPGEHGLSSGPNQHGLAAASRVLVAALAARPWSPDFYLAGSAALALHLGHRQVRDLDLMGWNRLTSPERRDLLVDLLAIEPTFKVETARDGLLYLRAAAGGALRFFYYPYPLIDPEELFEGLHVASAVDLGLMKLGAITSRGSRRDYLDLYLLCRRLPLATLLERAPEKFGHVRDFPLQALKGLADFTAADPEPLPALAEPVGWEEVESWLNGEVRDLARRWLELPT
jgi:hypothetical protein